MFPIRLLLFILLGIGVAACQPGKFPPQASTQTAMSVSAAQSALARLGYKPGAADGILGPRTTEALSRFQRDQGLTVTGALDAVTSQALGRADEQNFIADPSDQPVIAAGGSAKLSDARKIVRRNFDPSTLKEVDLNGDDRLDVIATATHASGHCGAYLCSHMVLENVGSGYKVLVSDTLATAIQPTNRRTRGYLDLNFVGVIGNAGAVTTLRWNGRQYRR